MCRTLPVRMFSASTRTPISIDVRPAWLTAARKVTSSPTLIGSLKVTWSTDSVTA